MYEVEFEIRTFLIRNLFRVIGCSTLWNFQVWSSMEWFGMTTNMD